MLTEECQNRRNNQIPSAEIRVDAALLGASRWIPASNISLKEGLKVVVYADVVKVWE